MQLGTRCWLKFCKTFDILQLSYHEICFESSYVARFTCFSIFGKNKKSQKLCSTCNTAILYHTSSISIHDRNERRRQQHLTSNIIQKRKTLQKSNFVTHQVAMESLNCFDISNRVLSEKISAHALSLMLCGDFSHCQPSHTSFYACLEVLTHEGLRFKKLIHSSL